MARSIVFLCLLPLFFAFSAAARDAAFAPEYPFAAAVLPKEEPVSLDQPVQLQADHIEYAQQEQMITATGQVEVAQGETLLLCDRLQYDQARDIVTAQGHVSVLDATGNVLFADEVELRDRLHRGVIAQLKLRMNDASLFAATRAQRINEDVFLLENAVYSPCRVRCREDLAPGEVPSAPLWQMRAERVTLDQQKQTVVYRNSWMELFGVPVFYTPYLSHATPNADGKSGFTLPEIERSQVLGTTYRIPFYYAIAPDRAMTITPMHSSQEGLLLRSEYRQKYDRGDLRLDASITHPHDRDALGNLTDGRQLRGHFFADGTFSSDDAHYWGFNLQRTTDDTYMRKYEIDESTLLQSRVYGDVYDVIPSAGYSALRAEGLAFQGLAATDDAQRIPLVFPSVSLEYESQPGAYGDVYFLDSNATILIRDIGSKSRRLANNIGWKLPYITSNGQVIEWTNHLRADVYHVEDVTLRNGQSFGGTTGRLLPETSLLWRYPFIQQGTDSSLSLEPILHVAMSPSGGNPETLPNEDSPPPELTDNNLFSEHHFAGRDYVEQGARASYGIRSLLEYGRLYGDALIGQYIRDQNDPTFMISDHPEDHLSDYVGRVGMHYQNIYLAYRFRLDHNSLDARRKELELQYHQGRLHFSTSYLEADADALFPAREELATSGSVELSKRWVASGTLRRDLAQDRITDAGAELLFKNECVNVAAVVSRMYTRDREVKPDTKYLLRLSFKNLN